MHSSTADLLAEIEMRQDDVLARLDQLNSQIEQVLAAWGAPAKAGDAALPLS